MTTENARPEASGRRFSRVHASRVGGAPGVRAVRAVWLAAVEARPVVQIIYMLRFTAAYTLVGGPGPRWWLPVALATWLCASGCAYLFDGVMDVVEDRLNGSTRPIAAGRLSRRAASVMTAGLAAAALAGAFALGGPMRVLVPVMLVLGFAYSVPPVRLKRWSWASGATVLAAGLLTFAAGGSAGGALPRSLPLLVFALAMSLWMGLVGAVAKDFSDVFGDSAAGRRTLAVVRGVEYTARRLAANAVAVGVAFVVAAGAFVPALVGPSLAVLAGAVAVALTSLNRPAIAHERRPYRAFMVTQYAAHLAVLLVAIA